MVTWLGSKKLLGWRTLERALFSLQAQLCDFNVAAAWSIFLCLTDGLSGAVDDNVQRCDASPCAAHHVLSRRGLSDTPPRFTLFLFAVTDARPCGAPVACVLSLLRQL